MNTVEVISTVIPTFKQQLIFLKEREKLFKRNDESSFQFDSSSSSSTSLNSSSVSLKNSNSSSTCSTDFNASSISSTKFNSSSASLTNLDASSSSSESIPNHLLNEFLSQPTLEKSSDEQQVKQAFPDKYKIPPLPDAVLQDIEEGALHKFGPHYSNRQILVDAVVHDLIHKYELFYPTHQQFDVIGAAMVECLKLPITKQNVAIWKDALQTKLKRKRSEHPNHIEVQQYQLKYSRIGSGRPIKKRIGEVAPRDRQKQVMLGFYDEATVRNIQLKSDTLRDVPQVDLNNQLDLWNETMPVRRQYIRDNSTFDILKEFPNYSNPVLVFEEVKMMTKVDLSAAIRRQVPILIEKIVDTSAFITDSAPIRLLKFLCYQFNETIHHILCNTEPSTPYPTLVCVEDQIHIYVDFIRVTSTISADDALALLIAMYTIFELSFNKNNRSIRLLYSIIHADAGFLPNTLRIFLKEKKIDIYDEENKKVIGLSNISSGRSTTGASSEPLSVPEINQTSSSSIEDDDIDRSDPTTANSSEKNIDLILNISDDMTESNKIIEESSSVLIDTQNKQVNLRQRSQRGKKATPEKSKSLVLTNDDKDEDLQENHIPKNKRKSTSISRSIKRTRRN